jgi:hypothetical protein
MGGALLGWHGRGRHLGELHRVAVLLERTVSMVACFMAAASEMPDERRGPYGVLPD